MQQIENHLLFKARFLSWFVPFSSFPEREEGESQGQSCQIEMVEQENYAYFFKIVAPKLLPILILPTMTHFLRPSYPLCIQNTLKLQWHVANPHLRIYFSFFFFFEREWKGWRERGIMGQKRERERDIDLRVTHPLVASACAMIRARDRTCNPSTCP